MVTKINQIICSIVFLFIIYSVITTVGNIFKDNVISYLVDLFIAIEVFWFLEGLTKENK